MKKTGICIGGPRAGEWITNEWEIFKAPIMRDFSPIYHEVPVDWKETTIDVFTYKHFQIGIGDKERTSKIGFWVDVKEEHPFHHAMEELLACYAENVKREDDD